MEKASSGQELALFHGDQQAEQLRGVDASRRGGTKLIILNGLKLHGGPPLVR